MEAVNVFSNKRTFVIPSPIFKKDFEININSRNKINGLYLLNSIADNVISASFFDPQYRGVLDKMSYGNEGKRQKHRAELSQMSEENIIDFIKEIDRVLIKSGHLFLWIDKFHLCEGIHHWLKNTELQIVDLITWDKARMGMGYRTRRNSEYLLVLQKKPIKAKLVWKKHDIRDVWQEKIIGKIHTHQKPLELQKALIEAISNENEFILDPCAGSYSVLEACKLSGRNFIGGDLEG